MLWSAEEAAAATGGEARGNWQISGISIDSRSIAKGDLFVALKAARDGHDFVAMALAAGAGAALVSRVPDDVPADAPLLIVPDVQAGLEALGRAGRARFGGKLVAITGSLGKTSTKDMLKTMLTAQGKTHAAEKSFNNHWGVPITLAQLPRDADFAVIEIGMNHPGEIAPLTDMTRPDVAMITTIAPVHLAAFDSIAGIAEEKGAIFSAFKGDGIAVIPDGLETTKILTAAAGAAQKVYFGPEDTDWALMNVDIRQGQTIVQAQTPLGPLMFRLSSGGRHFAANALGALAAVDALGADAALAAQDLLQWSPPDGRGARVEITLDDGVADAGLILLDDAFNASPLSVIAGLETLKGEDQATRRVAILGDMLELGTEEIKIHQDLAKHPLFDMVDLVHCCGPLMRACYDALPAHKRGHYGETAEALVNDLTQLIRAGDAVLIKGSKGSRVSLVAAAMRALDVKNKKNRRNEASEIQG